MKNFKSFSESLSIGEVHEYLNILNDIFTDLIDDSKRTHIYYNHVLSSSQELNKIEVESIGLEKTSTFSVSNNDETLYPFFAVELTFGKENIMMILNQCLDLIKRIELEGIKLLSLINYSNISFLVNNKWFSIGISNDQFQKFEDKIIRSNPIEMELRFKL